MADFCRFSTDSLYVNYDLQLSTGPAQEVAFGSLHIDEIV